MQIILISLLFLSLNSYAQEAKFDYKPLKDIRQEIFVPKISLANRKKIIENARFVYNTIFVHRLNKLEIFGDQASPLAELAKIEAEQEKLSDLEFSQRIVLSYNTLNDWHTYVSMPIPYSCFRTVLPVSFKRVVDETGNEVIAAEKFAAEEFLSLLPFPLTIEKGDVLVSFNGKDPEVEINEIKKLISSANPEAQERAAVNYLTWRSQNMFSVPENDEVSLTLKNSEGKLYKVRLPWLTRRTNSCVKKMESAESGRIALDEMHEVFSDRSTTRSRNKVFKNKNVGTDDYLPTDEPTLKYKTFQYEGDQFGIIKLESFYPDKLTLKQVSGKIRSLLATEFKNTTGVIFDLRNNLGGQIHLAETLVQYFSPEDIEPLYFNLNANEFIAKYLDITRDSDSNAVNEALAQGLPFAKVQIFPKDTIPQEGQFYFGPVGLLTNASCYSSCDMLSAQVQDNTDALIFGEDSTTGAGGANNWYFASLYDWMPEDNRLFDKMPLGIDIGFSYRQTIRGGRNQGKILENLGVQSDVIVKPTLKDLRTSNSQQFGKIALRLKEQSANKLSWVDVENETIEVQAGSRIVFDMAWSHTSEIEIRKDGVSIERRMVNYDQEKASFEIHDLTELPLNVRYEVIGFDGDKKAWRKVLRANIIPQAIQLPRSELFTFPLDASQKFIKTMSNFEGEGFVFEEGTLRTSGNIYRYGIDTNAYFSMLLPSEYTLQFYLSLLTEENFDFLKVVIVADGKEVELLKLSGSIEQTISLNLNEYSGKEVKVKFQFKDTSDTTMTGIVIKDLKLVPSL